MNEDFQVIGFYLTSNADVELHEQQQLEMLAKKKVLNRNVLEYNQHLSEFLKQYKRENREEEAVKAKHKKLVKELAKMDQLNEIDRIAILNNKFNNEAQLILKVQNCQNLTAKQRKMVMQLHQKDF